MLREINKILRPVRNRIASLVGRCLIAAVDDSKAIQIVQLSGVGGRVLGGVERIQNFGFSSVPPADAEAVVLCVGGSTESPIVIVCDSGKNRKKNLTAGDSCQYDAHGEYVVLSENKIEIYSKKEVAIIGSQIDIGGSGLAAQDGVVTRICQCAFTGGPHPVGSSIVRAKQV